MEKLYIITSCNFIICFYFRYNAKLKVAEKVGIRKAFTSGLSMGTFSIVMASSQAIAFW